MGLGRSEGSVGSFSASLRSLGFSLSTTEIGVRGPEAVSPRTDILGVLELALGCQNMEWIRRERLTLLCLLL